VQRLTPIIGPISRHLVEDEARNARTVSDLVARLAERVPANQRGAFLASARDIGG